jgi:hypothetical protein
MAANDLRVAHQPDLGGVTDLDPAEAGLLEIPVDPEGMSIDVGLLQCRREAWRRAE